jgi:hypothetical protein
MAGARKSRHSKEGTANRERYGKRRSEHRAPLPVIIVVCDDSKTSVAYLKLLQRELKRRLTLRIYRSPADWATAAQTVDCAEGHLKALQEASAHDDSDQNSVWALIDLEQEGDRRQKAEQAKADGRTRQINVALSDPCYEVWTLLHLVDTGETFLNCSAVIERLEAEWHKRFGQPFGPKAQADYSKIIGDRLTAAARARVRRERPDPSWTEMYLLIEEIAKRSTPTAEDTGP